MEVVLVPKFDHASYDSFLAGYSTEYDPDMIYSNYYTTSPGNNMKYSNAEVDKYLEEGLGVPVFVADNALDCVAEGCGIMLENTQYLK